MGILQNEPITMKESSYCVNHLYRVGASCMQGWRSTMEDAHKHILSLANQPNVAYFAVFDGHGGDQISVFAGEQMHKFIQIGLADSKLSIEEVLQSAFIEIDSYMLNEMGFSETTAGSTAVVVLIKEQQLFCANAGDSRAIAAVNGVAVHLSEDHKPKNGSESARIHAAGGTVIHGRVNGNLAVSRALGDFSFKKNINVAAQEQMVTALPDVAKQTIDDQWEFIILACDGIWDVLSSQEVVDFCRLRIGMGLYPEEICEELMTHCLAPDSKLSAFGADNMTVIMICLLHNETYTELIERCASATSNIVLNKNLNSVPSTDEVLNSLFESLNLNDET